MITRRMFVGGVAGVGLAQNTLVLEAIAAERMPHRIVVRGVEWAPFFEVRDYGPAKAQVAKFLNRHGIRPVWEDGGRFLFSFESLATRERAWREIVADADWCGAALREIAVYRSI
jgi:hypothetical protein